MINLLSSWDNPLLKLFEPFFVAYIWTIIIILLIISLTLYIFNGAALFTIAKRRGVRYYGLAWVPVGNLWVAGCLADGYDNATTGKNSNLRGKLMWISLAVHCALLTIVFAPFMIIGLVVLYIFYYVAVYKIYNSCMDKDNLMFFCVSAVLPIVIPFKLFSIRHKDEGFPFIKEKANKQQNNTRFSAWVEHNKNDAIHGEKCNCGVPAHRVLNNISTNNSPNIDEHTHVNTEHEQNIASESIEPKSNFTENAEHFFDNNSETSDVDFNHTIAAETDDATTLAPNESEPRPLSAPVKETQD